MKHSSKSKNWSSTLRSIALLTIVVLAAPLSNTARCEDKSVELERYKPIELKDERITSVGSDSMDALMVEWVKAYGKVQPKVTVHFSSRGSAAAPAALIEGTADLGPMARAMKTPELAEFKKRYGFEPTQIRTAVHGVAIYVSINNPVNEISLQDLDAIFSTNRKRGGSKTITSWKELGVKGKFSSEKIMALGGVMNPYLPAFFKQKVLLQDELGSQVNTIASEISLREAVSANPGAIGYGPIGLENGVIKALKVRDETGDQSVAVGPTLENIMSERYPLGRFLNMYLVRYPGEPIEPSTRDFISFILSAEGQSVAQAQGLIPLTSAIVKQELAKLE